MNMTPQTTTGLPRDCFLRPSVARIDNFMTGGTDNYDVDRKLARGLVQLAPWLPHMVAINERHRPHAVSVLARELGISQFLDLGCGLASAYSSKLQRHDLATPFEAAVGVHAAARVVYVTYDPVVSAHARTISDVNEATEALQADVCRTEDLLAHPKIQAIFDHTSPIGVLVHDLLPWVADEVAAATMAVLRSWLPAGSAISLTHASTDRDPQAMKSLVDGYAEAGIAYRPRPLEQVRSLLSPWHVLPPGLVPTAQWLAGSIRGLPSTEYSHAYAAIVTEARP
ncbi:SAM-dependent methyltransferase [Streptomyces sp. NPDC057623]|uniref:SAM-dependent methyltransferase n=1 Tax=Streptomyces sp. NPDC057623 TaxID=3346187 RepID=UPI0036AB32A0